jgi:hypothetical protein
LERFEWTIRELTTKACRVPRKSLPPPTPDENRLVTPIQKHVAMAASTAEPFRFRTSVPVYMLKKFHKKSKMNGILSLGISGRLAQSIEHSPFRN